ncbi:MAG: phenylalanine--tRNA ligase beta subunit-related protein [Herpetosiphon sp.]
MDVRIDGQLAAALPELRLGVVTASEVRIGAGDAELWNAMQEVAAELQALWRGRSASDRPEIAATRRGYRKLGDDPAHYRPSNEALLRRVMGNKGLPQVNSAVDVTTLVSLRSGWPLGCYARERIVGPVVARVGRLNERYVPIGKPEVEAHHRLVLCDDHAQPIFGSPTADSQRTQVDMEVAELLVVIFAFDGIPPEGASAEVGRLLEQFGGAQRTTVRLVAAGEA